MNACTRCNDQTHLEFPDGSRRCNGCDRTPLFCRCAPVATTREPLWLTLARQRRGGLSKDLTGAAA